MAGIECLGTESRLASCRFYGWGNNNCSHSSDVGVVCGNLKYGSVRLRGGPNSYSGRVEVFRYGEWDPVCDDSWGISEANVVCRQLGFPRATGNAHFGKGSEKIWMDNVDCSDTQTRLTSCYYWSSHDCSHHENASVVCAFGPTVRVSGGNDNRSGRVEVYLNEQWGTICGTSWDINSANVACRQLGFEFAVRLHYDAYFGQGRGPVWMGSISCSGHEKQLKDCSFNSGTAINCSHYEDSGVTCDNEEGRLRLIEGGEEGNSGRLEVKHNGLWGTVCDHLWDLKDAHVACHQLGYWRASYLPQHGWFGVGNGTIWMAGIECRGMETHLASCDFHGWGNNTCSHSSDVGIFCEDFTEGAVSLRGGPNYYSGRVEIFHNNTWGTVCDNLWSHSNGNVVCRQLGFHSATATYSRAHFGRGGGPIWMDEVRCTGNEQSLSLCGHNSWGKNRCSHSEDASVSCAITCDEIEVANATLSTAARIYGTTVRVDCFHGYWLARTYRSLYCTKTGVWHPLPRNCLKVLCYPLRNISNGLVSVSGLEVGDIATYSCKTGYSIRPYSVRRVCSWRSSSRRGYWSFNMSHCEIVNCGYPSSPYYGGMEISTWVYGGKVNYSCYDGFQLVGMAKSHCDETGKWSSPTPTCKGLCSSGNTTGGKGTYNWPDTYSDETANLPCVVGSTGRAYRICRRDQAMPSKARWFQADTSACLYLNLTTRLLADIKKRALSDNVHVILKMAFTVVQNTSSPLLNDDIDLIAGLVSYGGQQASQMPEPTQRLVIQEVVQVMSEVMKSELVVTGNTSEKLRKTVSRSLAALSEHLNGTFFQTTENMVFATICKQHVNDSEETGLRLTELPNGLILMKVLFSSNTKYSLLPFDSSIKAQVLIPSVNMFRGSTVTAPEQECSLGRINIAVYGNRKLFLESNEFSGAAIKPGIVVTVGDGPKEMDNSEPFNITFALPRGIYRSQLHVCSFWDNQSRSWNTSGCTEGQLSEDQRRYYRICLCHIGDTFSLLTADAGQAGDQLLLQYFESITRKTKLWRATLETVQSIVADLENIVVFSRVQEGMNADMQKKITDHVLRTVNTLLHFNQEILASSQSNSKTSERLMNIVETVADSLVMSEGEETKFTLPNIALVATCPNSSLETSLVFDVTGPLDSGSLEECNLTLSQVYQKDSIDLVNKSLVSFTVPFKSFSVKHKQAIPDVAEGCQNRPLSFSIFSSDKLFRTNGQTNTPLPTVVSKVVNARIGRGSGSFLVSPVEIVFALSTNKTVAKKFGFEWTCSYWNSVYGAWSDKGCREVPLENSSHVAKCVCDHLTSFAVTMWRQLKSTYSLSAMTYISCGLSLLAAACCLISFGIFRNLPQSTRQRLTYGLSACLAILLVVFIVGVEATSNSTACKTVALFLHFFVLSVFGWLAAQAVHLHFKLIIICGKSVRLHTLVLVLCCGLPFLIVVLTATVSGLSVYTNKSFCWLNNKMVFYTSICAPLALLLLFNMSCLLKITESVSATPLQKWKAVQQKRRAYRLLQNLSLSAAIGLTWMFSTVVVLHNSTALQHIFTCFNFAQALTIFLVNIYADGEVCSEWLYCFGLKKLPEERRECVTGFPSLPDETSSHGQEQQGRRGSNEDGCAEVIGNAPVEENRTSNGPSESVELTVMNHYSASPTATASSAAVCATSLKLTEYVTLSTKGTAGSDEEDFDDYEVMMISCQNFEVAKPEIHDTNERRSPRKENIYHADPTAKETAPLARSESCQAHTSKRHSPRGSYEHFSPGSYKDEKTEETIFSKQTAVDGPATEDITGTNSHRVETVQQTVVKTASKGSDSHKKHLGGKHSRTSVYENVQTEKVGGNANGRSENFYENVTADVDGCKEKVGKKKKKKKKSKAGGMVTGIFAPDKISDPDPQAEHGQLAEECALGHAAIDGVANGGGSDELVYDQVMCDDVVYDDVEM